MDSTLLLSRPAARAAEQPFTQGGTGLSAAKDMPAFSSALPASCPTWSEQHDRTGAVRRSSLGAFPSPLSCSSTQNKTPLSFSSSVGECPPPSSSSSAPSTVEQGWKASLPARPATDCSFPVPVFLQTSGGSDIAGVPLFAGSDTRQDKPPLSDEGFGRTGNRSCNSVVYPGDERRGSSAPNDLSQDASSYSRQLSSHSDVTTRPSLSHCTSVPSPQENPIGYRNLEQFLSVCLQRYAHLSKKQERAACMCLFNAVHHALSRYNAVLKKWAFIRWHVSSVLAVGSPKGRRDHSSEFFNARSLPPLLPCEHSGPFRTVSSLDESTRGTTTGRCFSDQALVQFLRHRISHSHSSGAVANFQKIRPSDPASSHRQTPPVKEEGGNVPHRASFGDTRLKRPLSGAKVEGNSAYVSSDTHAPSSGSMTRTPTVEELAERRNTSSLLAGEEPKDGTGGTAAEKTTVTQHNVTTAGSAMVHSSASSNEREEAVGGGCTALGKLRAPPSLSRQGRAGALSASEGDRLGHRLPGHRANALSGTDVSRGSTETTSDDVQPKQARPRGKESHLCAGRPSRECTSEACATSDIKENFPLERRARGFSNLSEASRKQASRETAAVQNRFVSDSRAYVSPTTSKAGVQQNGAVSVQRRQHTRGGNTTHLLEAVASALSTKSQERAVKLAPKGWVTGVGLSATDVQASPNKDASRGSEKGSTTRHAETSRDTGTTGQEEDRRAVLRRSETEESSTGVNAWLREGESLASAKIKLRTHTLSVMAASLLSRDYESLLSDLNAYTTSGPAFPSADPSPSTE